jgi:hypothetical protein
VEFGVGDGVCASCGGVYVGFASWCRQVMVGVQVGVFKMGCAGRVW